MEDGDTGDGLGMDEGGWGGRGEGGLEEVGGGTDLGTQVEEQQGSGGAGGGRNVGEAGEALGELDQGEPIQGEGGLEGAEDLGLKPAVDIIAEGLRSGMLPELEGGEVGGAGAVLSDGGDGQGGEGLGGEEGGKGVCGSRGRGRARARGGEGECAKETEKGAEKDQSDARDARDEKGGGGTLGLGKSGGGRRGGGVSGG